MKRWCLVVVAFNVLAAIVTMVTLAIGVPRMPRLWLPLDPFMFAVFCAVSCFIGNSLGPNGRSKALLGVIFSWMLGGPLVGIGVGALFGQPAKLASMLGPALVLAAVALLFRDWFRAGGSTNEADNTSVE